MQRTLKKIEQTNARNAFVMWHRFAHVMVMLDNFMSDLAQSCEEKGLPIPEYNVANPRWNKWITLYRRNFSVAKIVSFLSQYLTIHSKASNRWEVCKKKKTMEIWKLFVVFRKTNREK
jgi:hypothetical protein